MITMKSAPFAYKLGALAALAVVLPVALLIWLGHPRAGLLWLLSLPLWVGLFLSLSKPLLALPEQLHRLQQEPDLTMAPMAGDPEAEVVLVRFQKLLKRHQKALRKSKRLEKERQKSALLYQSLWGLTASGAILLDDQRRILSVNPALRILCGYENEELAGQEASVLWAPEDQKLAELIWQPLTGKGQASSQGSHSLRLVHKDGDIRWVELGVQELPELCAPFKYLMLLRDISGQKQALDLLHLERRKSLSLLDAVQEAVVLTDEQGRVQYLNPAATALFAMGQEAVSGRCLWPLLPLYRVAGSELQPLADGPPEPGHHGGLVLVGTTGERRAIELTVVSVREDDTGPGLRILLFRQRDEQALTGNVDWAQSHDPLTGLANRAAFEVRLEEYLQQNLEDQAPIVVALVDLDHFRQLNEQAGREVGDQMLQQVARILLHNVRRCDLVARLGADEFALLLTGCDSQRALLITEGIRADLEKYRLEVDGQPYRITASLGLTELSGQDQDVQQIFRRLDEGCYRSKAQGRNLVSLVEAVSGPGTPLHQNL